jgi:chromosome segregation ATPase
MSSQSPIFEPSRVLSIDPLASKNQLSSSKYEGVLTCGNKQFKWEYDTGSHAKPGLKPTSSTTSINEKVQKLFAEFVQSENLGTHLNDTKSLNIHTVKGIGHIEGDKFNAVEGKSLESQTKDDQLAVKIHAFLQSVETAIKEDLTASSHSKQEVIIDAKEVASNGLSQEINSLSNSPHQDSMQTASSSNGNAGLKQQINDNLALIQSLQTQISSLQSKIDQSSQSYKAEIDQQRQLNFDLTTQLSQQNHLFSQEISSSRQNNEQLMNLVESLRQQLLTNQRELGDLQAAFKKQEQIYTKKIQQKKTKIQSKKAEISKLERRLDFARTKSQIVPVLKGQITAQKRALKSSQDELKSLQANLQSGTQLFHVVSSRLQETEKNLEQNKAVILKKIEQIDEINAKLSKVNIRVESLTEQLQQHQIAESSSEALQQQLELQLKQAAFEKGVLQGKLRDAEDLSQSLKADVEKLQAKQSQLLSKSESELANSEQLKNELRATKLDLEKLQMALSGSLLSLRVEIAEDRKRLESISLDTRVSSQDFLSPDQQGLSQQDAADTTEIEEIQSNGVIGDLISLTSQLIHHNQKKTTLAIAGQTALIQQQDFQKQTEQSQSTITQLRQQVTNQGEVIQHYSQAFADLFKITVGKTLASDSKVTDKPALEAIDALKTRISSLLEIDRKVKAENADLQKELIKLKGQLEVSQQEQVNLQSQIVTLEGNIQSKTHQQDINEEEKKQIATLIEELTSQQAIIQKALGIKAHVAEELADQQPLTTIEQLEKLIQLSSRQQESIGLLRQQTDDMSNELSANKETQSILESQLAHLNLANRECNERLATNNLENNQLQEKQNLLEKDILQLNQKLTESKNSNVLLKMERDQAKAAIARNQQIQLENLADIEHKNKKISQNKQTIIELQSQKSDLEKMLQQEQKENLEYSQKINELKDKIFELQKANTALEHTNKYSIERNEELELSNQEFQILCNQSNKTILMQEALISELTSENMQLQQTKIDLEQKIAQKEGLQHELVRTNLKLKSELDVISSQKEELERANDDLKENIQSAAQAGLQLLEANQSLNTQLREYQDQEVNIEELESLLEESFRVDQERFKHYYEEAIVELNAKLSTKEDELESSIKQLEDKSFRLQCSLQSEAKLKECNGAKQTEIDRLKEKDRQLTQENSELNKQVNVYKSEHLKLKEAFHLQTKQLDQLVILYSETLKSTKQATKKIESAQEELLKTKSALEESQLRTQQLQTTIDSYEKRMTSLRNREDAAQAQLGDQSRALGRIISNIRAVL